MVDPPTGTALQIYPRTEIEGHGNNDTLESWSYSGLQCEV